MSNFEVTPFEANRTPASARVKQFLLPYCNLDWSSSCWNSSRTRLGRLHRSIRQPPYVPAATAQRTVAAVLVPVDD